MYDTQILSGKFALAELPQICAQRKRLLDIFHREADKRVIFVTAPPGYGKTTSTLLWLSNTGRKTIWLTLDTYDNAPAVFYRQFCAGIASVQPHNNAMMDVLRSPAFSSSPVEHTIRLLSEFWPEDERYAMVLDDVHLLTNQEIRKSGLLIQKRLPLSFITVIITRNEIAKEYTSSIGEGKYGIITAKELAFTAEEIQDYFVKYGRILTKKEAAKVHEITDGWVIGVNALVKSQRIKLAENGSHILADYIEEQIWNKWDQELRDFMLKTSVVDEMTPELCEMLTGRSDSREVLDNLCNLNAFTIKLSEDSYRYHHLFLDFLRNIQNQCDPDAINALNKKAADYYMLHGEYLAARPYATRCGDPIALMQVIYNLSQYRSASVDEFVNYAKMYDAPPESTCDHLPFLYPSLMWENYLRGNAELMEYYMDKTYKYLPVIAKDFPQDMEAVLMELSLDHRVPLSQFIEQFTQMPPMTKVHLSQQGASLTHEMPFMHRSNRDYYELTDEALHDKARNVMGAIIKDVDVVIMEIYSGLLLEQNRLQTALDTALKTFEYLHESTSEELRFCAMIHLSAIYFAMKSPKYNQSIEEIESFIDLSGAHYLRPNFIAYKTRNLLFKADTLAAQGWLKNYFVVETDHLDLYKIYQHFTTARAYIVIGDSEKAAHYLDMLEKLASDFKRPTDLAEARVLKSILQWASGEKERAQETLENAIPDMQELSYVRVFADEGASILPILKKLLAKVEKKDYEGPIQSHYLREVALAAYEQSKRTAGIVANWRLKPIKLSKQQKLVLSLLAQGHKYNDIVEATGLTIHTVKSHVSAAYRKLNVGNSMDAIMKAKELGLIE